jgi:hypothetical protein
MCVSCGVVEIELKFFTLLKKEENNKKCDTFKWEKE